MRKQTKLVAVVSAAALLAIGASMTSFAATGWVEEGGEWFYYDKDGNKAEDEWKKSGDKWFWLDSEESGAMALDKLIDDGDNTYYVDATGAMVANTWVKVVNEDQDDEDDPAEYNYYYMQANGKAYKTTTGTKFKTIDGKRYAFGEDGKMLYGWVDNTGNRLSGDDGWATPLSDGDKMYYLGSWDDGAMKTGWQKIAVTDDDDDKDYWFYFNSNGTKFFDDEDDTLETKTINGKKYGFDDRGVMVSQWNVASSSAAGLASPSAENWSYFNSPEDGARVTKGWFKVIAPTDDTTFTEGLGDTGSFDKDNADDEAAKWYYANGDGTLEAGKIVKIKGKYYAFNGKGAMVSGLAYMTVDSEGEVTVHDGSVDADELDDLMAGKDLEADASLYYFGDNADADGSMKTGNVTVTIDGDTHNFKFSSTGGVEGRGKGLTGMDDNKYIYNMGKKLKAGTDQKYIVVKTNGTVTDDNITVKELKSKDFRTGASASTDTNKDKEKVKAYEGFAADEYLIGTSGAIVKNKTAARDGDDWYFYVKDSEVKMYTNNKSLPDSLKNWDEDAE